MSEGHSSPEFGMERDLQMFFMLRVMTVLTYIPATLPFFNANIPPFSFFLSFYISYVFTIVVMFCPVVNILLLFYWGLIYFLMFICVVNCVKLVHLHGYL